MIVYLDTSALFKLYAAEPGASDVRDVVEEAATAYTHLIAYAEVCAGFAKAVRLGRITAGEAEGYRRDLDRDWEQFGILMPDQVMIRRAGDLALRFGLRGYDSVHLAAAESLRVGRGADLLRFASFDERLNQSAGELGLRLLA